MKFKGCPDAFVVHQGHFDSAKIWFGFPFAPEYFSLCKCSQKTTASSQVEVCLMRKENLIWWREQDPCSTVLHQDSTGKARGHLPSLQLQITGIAITDHSFTNHIQKGGPLYRMINVCGFLSP